MPKALFKSDDEWFEVIQRCRTSGMTDKDWCEANGISQTSLYRFIRKLKKKSYEIPDHLRFKKQEVVPIQIIPDEQESLPSSIPEQDMAARRGVSTRQSGIHISCGSFRTVYQDDNYRELPEFAKRCIEEFGADYVRLHPYDPWGGEGMKEWMMDVRNVYHPRNEDFLEVMKDPIFTHPKVHDWGGGNESGLGPEPYWKTRTMFSIINGIFTDSFMKKVEEAVGDRKVVVYGMTVVGKALASRLKNEGKLAYCLDRKMDGMSYLDVPIYGINHFEDLDKDVSVIIAIHWSEDVIGDVKEHHQTLHIHISRVHGLSLTEEHRIHHRYQPRYL